MRCTCDIGGPLQEARESLVGIIFATTEPSWAPRSFAEGEDRREWCTRCGRHIRYHYGMTEYRCDPKEG